MNQINVLSLYTAGTKITLCYFVFIHITITMVGCIESTIHLSVDTKKAY